MATAPKQLFSFHFGAGETVPDTEFTRFEPFMARLPGEPSRSYAQRLEQAGLAFVLSSRELATNIPRFKSTLAAARDAGIPVAMLTAPVPDPIGDRIREREQKSVQDYLAEARAAQTQGAPQS